MVHSKLLFEKQKLGLTTWKDVKGNTSGALKVYLLISS